MSGDETSACSPPAGSLFSALSPLSHYGADRWYPDPRGKGLIRLKLRRPLCMTLAGPREEFLKKGKMIFHCGHCPAPLPEGRGRGKRLTEKAAYLSFSEVTQPPGCFKQCVHNEHAKLMVPATTDGTHSSSITSGMDTRTRRCVCVCVQGNIKTLTALVFL